MLAQAPVRPLPLDGFDPADVPGSLDRMVEFNRQSAKSHSGVYRDLAVRHRPTEAGAILGPLEGVLLRRIGELVRAIERGERTCTRENLDLLATCERAERLGLPLNAIVAVTGAPARAAAGPLAGRAGRRQGHRRGGGPAEALRQPGHEPMNRRRRTPRW